MIPSCRGAILVHRHPIRRVGPNFAELPINRPLEPVHNNQRDAMARTVIAWAGALVDPT
jgi:catalase